MRNLPRRSAIKLIELYQQTLSPDHGPLKDLHPYGFCRHEPTCSEYAKEMIEKQGVMMGGIRSILRILSCNPWATPSKKRIMRAFHGQSSIV